MRVLVRPGRYTSDLPGESAKVSFIAGFGSSDARSVCTRQDPVDEENRMAIEIDQCVSLILSAILSATSSSSSIVSNELHQEK